MSIEEAVKEFLKKLSIKLEIFDYDLELSYATDVLNTLIQNVKANIPEYNSVSYLISIVEKLSDDGTIDLSDDISTYINLNRVELCYLSKKKNTKFRIRNFSLASSFGAIIPISYIENQNPYKISQPEKDKIERKIREVILHYSQHSISQSEFSNFFQKVMDNTKNAVIAVYDDSCTDFVHLYSKSYFLYLLKGYKTLFPGKVVHNYHVDSSLIAEVESSSNNFTQFFEIYDVMDEYHHADDILVKYLKLYQIIEYLITRTLLVKIQKNSSNQNLFLREMTSLSKYDDFDKDNFKIVFKTNETDLGNWFKGKLDENSKLKKTVESILYPNKTKTLNTGDLNACYNALLNLIYKIRNTIVHNKESEIHLTMHNIQLRNELLKLIKDLLLKLENILFQKVVNFEEVITYKGKNLELY